MVDVTKEDAEEIATRQQAGTRFRCKDFEGFVETIQFGDHRSDFKLETIRTCVNGGPEPQVFRATFGIRIEDLRGWCAERYSCPRDSITFWFEE